MNLFNHKIIINQVKKYKILYKNFKNIKKVFSKKKIKLYNNKKIRWIKVKEK